MNCREDFPGATEKKLLEAARFSEKDVSAGFISSRESAFEVGGGKSLLARRKA
jgi:hypothetical protein